PVGARDVELVLAGVREVEDASVLEVPIDDRADLDVLADADHARPEAAHAANDELDRDPGLGRAVESLDDVFVDERVHLRDDARRTALARVLRFPRDEP